MEFPETINGWTLYAHPCFLDTYNVLLNDVGALKKKDPEGYQKKALTKLLAVVHKVIESHIAMDPASSLFRHGTTLGRGKKKDWSRAKFGAGRYGLFFRYSEKEKVIVLGWMNDAFTLRTYNSKTDAYVVSGNMLDKGRLPVDWQTLLSEAMGSASR